MDTFDFTDLFYIFNLFNVNTEMYGDVMAMFNN